MSRIIKFRAYHSSGSMQDVGCINWNDGVVEPLGGGEEACIEDVVLMQFTGLFDKNGKEIYDGDICKNGNGDIRVIFWNTMGMGGWWATNKLGDHVTQINCQLLEVIGNIHENPNRRPNEDRGEVRLASCPFCGDNPCIIDDYGKECWCKNESCLMFENGVPVEAWNTRSEPNWPEPMKYMGHNDPVGDYEALGWNECLKACITAWQAHRGEG